MYWVEEFNKDKLNTDLAAANLIFADDAGKAKLKQDMSASLGEMHRALDNVSPSITFRCRWARSRCRQASIR